MKLKYLLMGILAAAAGVFTSCNPDEDVVNKLDGIKLGSTYITIAKGETSATTTMSITKAWTSEAPEWLTVSPESGEAGDYTLTFTALADTLDRGSVLIKFGSKVQNITVVRDGEKPKKAGVIFEEPFVGNGQGDFETIDKVGSPWGYDATYGMKATAYINAANTDAESYLVSPEIDLTEETVALLTFEHAVNYMNGQSIADYLSVEVTEDNGANWTAVEVPTWPLGSNWTFVASGDVDLTAYLGKKIKFAFHYKSTTTASPTWEIKNVKIASIAGAVPPALTLDVTSVLLGAEEDLTAAITATTDGTLAVTGPFSDSACETALENPWFTYTLEEGVVTVTAAVNEGEARTAYLKFTSTNEFGATPAVVTVSQIPSASSKGATLDNPYSVAEVIAALDAAADNKINGIYVKGIITSVDSYNATYGSITYWIADDADPESPKYEVYSGLFFDGAKFSGKEDLEVGYEVVVRGNAKIYKKAGNPDIYEFDKNNVLCSLNGATAYYDVAGVKAALDAVAISPSQLVIVKGIINKIDNISWDATAANYYGNAQYWISDDGASADFEIYRGFYFGGAKFTAEDQIAVGDTVKVLGKVKIYKKEGKPDVYEFDANNYILQLIRPEGPAYVPAITVDGDLTDWAGVADAYNNSGNSRVRAFKFKSDEQMVYFLVAMRKNRAWNSEPGLFICFDIDGDESTGTSQSNLKGLEAYAQLIPFSNDTEGSEPVGFTGIDANSVVWSATLGNHNGTASVAHFDAGEDVSTSSSNTYLEVGIPREYLGLPAAGGTVKVGMGFNYYVTDMVEVTME